MVPARERSHDDHSTGHRLRARRTTGGSPGWHARSVTIAAPPSPASRARVLLGQVVVTLALFGTSGALVAVLLPGRVADLDPHGKVGALGAIHSIAFAANALAVPALGALSDRTRTALGRRLPWMIAGALLGGGAIAAIGTAPSVVLIGVLWVVVQPSMSTVQVAADAFLVDVFPPARRGLAAGVVGIAVVVGAGAGAVLSGRLVDSAATLAPALGVAVVAAVLVFAILVRDRATAVAPRERRPVLGSLRAVVRTVIAHPDFVKILLWRIAFSIGYGTVFAYLLYVLTDLVGIPKGHAAPIIGLATALGGTAALLAVVLGGWLSDRLARRRAFVVGASVLLVAGDLIMLALPSTAALLVTAVVFGAGLGLAVSCGRALASQVLPNQRDGAAAGLGTVATATNIGQAIAPAIGGLVIGWGGYPALFAASLVMAGIAIVPVVLIRSVR